VKYRDEYDALQQKAEGLAERLAESEAEATRAKDELARERSADRDGRIVKLGEEIARAQKSLDAMRRELDELRGGPRRASRPWLPVVAGVVVLGVGVGAFAALQSSAPPVAVVQTPHVPVAPAPPLPIEPPATGPKKLAPGQRPMTPEDAGFEPRRREITWQARVRHAERIPLAPGDACTIRAAFETFWVWTRANEDLARANSLEVHCGEREVYRMKKVEDWHTKLHELPGDAPGTFRHTLEFDDSGDPQVTLNSDEGFGTIVGGGASPFRLDLDVDYLGSEVKGQPLFASTDTKKPGLASSRDHAGKVTAASGEAPVKAGAACVVREQAIWQRQDDNCELRIVCGGKRVYRDWVACPADGNFRLSDLQPGSEDGTPRLELDVAAGKAALSEPNDPKWSFTITLDR
jgi:hypothetical protein